MIEISNSLAAASRGLGNVGTLSWAQYQQTDDMYARPRVMSREVGMARELRSIMATKVAVIQKPPVLLDRGKTIGRTVESIAKRHGRARRCWSFPRPTYRLPDLDLAVKPGGDMGLSNEIHARLRANAVDLGGNDLKPVQEAASKHGVTVVVGLMRSTAASSGTTLFNTVAVIGADGAILNRHRKLMPTNPERMVWAWAMRPVPS